MELSDSQDFVVIGPGLSLDPEQQLTRELTANLELLLLIDGDGLSAPCAPTIFSKKRSAPTVLTPHMGEMSCLTGCSIAEIE
ncbi:MAG: NAD(P)H-hydrate dehydratase [Syntrophotaleaceae bacterium]